MTYLETVTLILVLLIAFSVGGLGMWWIADRERTFRLETARKWRRAWEK